MERGQRILQRQSVIVTDRGCETPHEIFGRQINHARIARAVDGRIRDGLQKMCLAEAHTRMDEQRIKTHGTSAGFCDRLCGCKRNTVGGTFYKRLEGETGIQR